MKKIIFGAILSAFLLLSVQWLAPIQVKAAGDADTIKQQIGELANDLTNDENLKNILNDPNLQNLMSKVLNGEEDLQTLVNAIQAKEEFDTLKNTYSGDINTLKNNLLDFPQPKNKGDNNYEYYRIFVDDNNMLRIEGQDNEDITEGILLNKNGNLKIPTETGAVWLDEIDWLDLLGKLAVILLGLAIVVAVIIAVCVVLLSIFTWIVGIIESAITALIVLAVVIVAVATIFAWADDIIEFIQGLLNPNGDSDDKTKSSKKLSKLYLKVVSTKLKEFFNRILSFFNIQQKLCFA